MLNKRKIDQSEYDNFMTLFNAKKQINCPLSKGWTIYLQPSSPNAQSTALLACSEKTKEKWYISASVEEAKKFVDMLEYVPIKKILNDEYKI